MAIKKISQFTSGTPTASDKILFEQSGAGKSATIEYLGKAIGINRELLWTNANPTSDFITQTISIGANSYKLLIIVFRASTSSPYLHEFIFNINDYGNFKIFSSTDYSLVKTIFRAIVLTKGGDIEIKSAYFSDTYGNYTLSNQVLIPFKIYGVK